MGRVIVKSLTSFTSDESGPTYFEHIASQSLTNSLSSELGIMKDTKISTCPDTPTNGLKLSARLGKRRAHKLVAMAYEPTRGGTRGGKDNFDWEDVKVDKYRENYLGNEANINDPRML